MTSFTLGLEEELQVVDGSSFQLSSHDIARGKRLFPDSFGTTTEEAHQFVLELQSSVCHSSDELIKSLTHLRGLAISRAYEQGQKVASVSLHPTANWQQQRINDNPNTHPHYAQLKFEYQDLLRSLVICGTHVHIGVANPTLRIPVLNGLRELLPEILALSVSSPFYESRDTGLASWRHSILDRMPRMGICEAWPDEATYWGHVQQLRSMHCIPSDFNLWGDIRLHHKYPTIEVRVLDAMPRISRNWLVVSILWLEAMRLARETEAGKQVKPLCREFIDENKWRARRFGLDADLVDWRNVCEIPVSLALRNRIKSLQPLATEFGIWARLEQALEAALIEGTSSAEQQSVYAKTHSFREVMAHLVAQTEHAVKRPS